MSIFSRPLVALSLNDADAELLRYVSRAIAEGVCDLPRFAHVVNNPAIARDASQFRTLGERMRREVQALWPHAAGEAQFDVVAGSTLDQLLGLAVMHRSDVLLLGHRRGRSGRRSIARRLAMRAPCSVWLIPQGAPERSSSVLVPVDFSRYSGDALAVATALAARLGLPRCLALHVFFDPSTLRYPEHIEEFCRQERVGYERFLAGVDRHDMRVEALSAESPHPPQAILRTAEHHRVDLIVMSTRGRTPAAALLLSSVTAETMAATSIPLLAVKHFGRHQTLLQVLLDRRFWRAPFTKTN